MLKMYQIAKMTCVVCLDDGASFACECSAFHTRCFSDFLLRNGRKEECSTCYSRFDREMMAAASSILFTRTQSTFGASHGTTLVRKLELALALANSSGGSEAKGTSQAHDWTDAPSRFFKPLLAAGICVANYEACWLRMLSLGKRTAAGP